MKYLILVYVIIYFSGCAMDYSCSSEIVNNSSSNVTVSIMYNKDKMKQISDSVKSFDYLKSINFSGERTGQPFTLDTSTLEITFNLPPKKKAEISHAVGGQRIIPDYSLLKRIAVSYNNQKKEYYQNVLDTLFKEQKSGAWQFSIN